MDIINRYNLVTRVFYNTKKIVGTKNEKEYLLRT